MGRGAARPRDSLAPAGESREGRYFGGIDGAITSDRHGLREAIWTWAAHSRL